MPSNVEMCAICAWRATCIKKFNLSGRDVHCPDFSEDVSIRRAPSVEAEGDEDK